MAEDMWVKAINAALGECLLVAMVDGARNGRDGPEQALASIRAAMDTRLNELKTTVEQPDGRLSDASVGTRRRMHKVLDVAENEARQRLGLAALSRSAQ